MVSTATMVKDTDLRDVRHERPLPGVEERTTECSAEPLHGSTDRYREVRPLFTLEELQDESV